MEKPVFNLGERTLTKILGISEERHTEISKLTGEVLAESEFTTFEALDAVINAINPQNINEYIFLAYNVGSADAQMNIFDLMGIGFGEEQPIAEAEEE